MKYSDKVIEHFDNPQKIHGSVLAEDAIRAAIKDHMNKNEPA